jgi:selenocysteine-specific elongation factor
LDEPILARAGDHFVLRLQSPPATIGGGVVTDPAAPPRARAWPAGVRSAEELIERQIAESGAEGVRVGELPIRLGLSPGEADRLVARLDAWRVDDRLLAPAVRSELSARVLCAVADHHRAHPLDEGSPLQWLRSGSRAPAEVLDAAVGLLVAEGRVVASNGVIRLPGHSPRLSPAQDRLAAALLDRLRVADTEPPAMAELASELGADPGEVVTVARRLAREGLLIAVEPARFYLSETVLRLGAQLREGMHPDTVYGPAELRGLLGLTRKYLIPFLEYCDREGYTVRDELGRRKGRNISAR